MICSVRTLGVSGIQGSVVMAESYISGGLPGFDIVGLPDAAVKEARERGRGQKLGAEIPHQPDHRQSGSRQSEKGGDPL